MTFRLLLLLAAALIPSLLAHSDVEYPQQILSKVAFGSCHKRKYVNTTSPKTIWDTIAQHDNPELFVWTGDSIYPPTRGIAPLSMLQNEYRHMKHNASLGYSTFQPPLGIIGTYDDHDWGANDLGEEMPNKPQRAAAFMEFLDQPYNASRNGIYASFEYGVAPRKIKLILLDTRYNRQAHCIPSVAHRIPLGAAISCITRWITAGFNLPLYLRKCREPKTILGEQQWQWLEDTLSNSNAQVHVIVSSIQVLTTNPVMESWGHYPEERFRLLGLLNNVSAPILISGDVHHAEILADSSSTIMEVTSSGMTHTCTTPIYGYYLCEPLLQAFDAHRFSSKENYYIGKNYATLAVDWNAASFEVRVHDADTGSVVLTTGTRLFQQPLLSQDELEEIRGVNDGHLIPKAQKLVTFVIAVLIAWLLQKRFRRKQNSSK